MKPHKWHLENDYHSLPGCSTKHLNYLGPGQRSGIDSFRLFPGLVNTQNCQQSEARAVIPSTQYKSTKTAKKSAS